MGGITRNEVCFPSDTYRRWPEMPLLCFNRECIRMTGHVLPPPLLDRPCSLLRPRLLPSLLHGWKRGPTPWLTSVDGQLLPVQGPHGAGLCPSVHDWSSVLPRLRLRLGAQPCGVWEGGEA